MYLVEGHEEHKHPSLVPENIHRKRCTGQGLSKVLGLEICGEVEYPLIADVKSGPSLLLAGPLAAKVYLLKTDKELTTYNLEYRWDKQPVSCSWVSSVEINFNLGSLNCVQALVV